MILLDFNQTLIASYLVEHNKNKKKAKLEGIDENDVPPADENIIRHIALNSIRSTRTKFKVDYGEMVVCCDGRNSWRRELFPHYKARRKVKRESTKKADWSEVFRVMHMIQEEIALNLPYKVVKIDEVEADDIIATLAKRFNSTEDILICSSDKDFAQLHSPEIKQYHTIYKKILIELNPKEFLARHILIGDEGDGIPNFLSDDDTFVNEEKRQTPIYTKKLDQWINMPVSEFATTEQALRGYYRNKQLIDLSQIPSRIQEVINTTYDNFIPNKGKIRNYFIEKGLVDLNDSIQEFIY